MVELGFHDQNSVRSSGYIMAGDTIKSPDSVIFTRDAESNFSVFSSASASVDRCSFASDAHDHDSLASELSLHLAVPEGGDLHENRCGAYPEPNKATMLHKHSRFSTKGEKVKERDVGRTEDGNQLIDSARNSFSIALKECQDRRTRTEALLKNPDRRRQASLDFNNVSSSPGLAAMKKSSVATKKSGASPSPGTPNYHHQSSGGLQKGWSSEHVTLHNNVGRRQGNVAAAALPFNNRRTLPSKWEDAERWILSQGDNGVRQSTVRPQRRPKSKSGPLGLPGIACYSLYSPGMHMSDGGHTGNVMAGSAFSVGVIAADGFSNHSSGHGGGFAARNKPCMARSVSVHGCSEVVNTSSLPSQDENHDALKDAATDISRTVSRRDMATQMSPQGSTNSSPKERDSFSPSSPCALPIIEPQSINSSKSQVRDVQIDERVSMARRSKKQRARNTGKSSEIVDYWRKRAVESLTSTWDVKETARTISKVKREEAKITSWEKLQKAKADAAIRKLEMKLEKKRRSSVDKIMNDLRSAQKRAEEMRSLMLANEAHQQMRSLMVANEVHQVTKVSHKAISLRRTRPMGSLSGCFTCHAF